MSTRPVRRRRLPAAQRRVVILQAAQEVFAARGYHGSSIDEIATAAGVSKALIYEHFASKHALHASLLADRSADLFERLRDSATVGETGEARLRAGVDAFLSFVEEDREAFRVLFRDAADPELADALAVVQIQAVGVVAALMASDPQVPPDLPAHAVEQYAAVLAGGVQALANWWYDHQDVARAELVDRTLELVWPGLERLATR